MPIHDLMRNSILHRMTITGQFINRGHILFAFNITQ